MSRTLKRKYKQARREFKRDLLVKAKQNPALAMLIIETYAAWHHRRHITQIWGMFRNPDYKVFQKAYSKQLFGKHLTGKDDIWRSLYFTERELYDAYWLKVPSRFAMGDAVGVAYRALKNR